MSLYRDGTMAANMEMMAVQGGLGESHIFSYAGGTNPLRLQAPSAVYTCAGWDTQMHVFLFEWRGSLLRDFAMSFAEGGCTFAACEGVELDCSVEQRCDGSLAVTVEELRVDPSMVQGGAAYRAESGLRPWPSTPSCLPC